MESEDFENWLEENYKEFMDSSLPNGNAIYDYAAYFDDYFPFEFKWGVYQKYFLEQHNYLITILVSDMNGLWACGYKITEDKRHNRKSFMSNDYETLIEAQQEAVKKAFNLLEDGKTND